jgi:ferric-dicitrate binding protein FerR (iron transport regulator)
MEQLFDGVSVRREPSDAARQQAFEASLEVFRAQQKQRRRRRQSQILALAATVLIALVIFLQPAEQPASISVLVADASSAALDGEPIQAAETPYEIHPGALLSTQNPARLIIGRDTDLRLAAQTEVRWLKDDHIELIRGSVYVDTGASEDVTILTPQGTVRDIGTQFLVALTGTDLVVAVREGEAEVVNAHGRFSATAEALSGEVLTLTDGTANKHREALGSARWSWIDQVPRGYNETRIARLLEKIARDQGLQLEYVDSGTEVWVMNQSLSGQSLDRLTPSQALSIIAAAAGLEAEVSDQRLRVTRR